MPSFDPLVAFLVQPWLRRRVNRDLELFGKLAAATEQPWPERLAAVDAVVEPAARRTVRSDRLDLLGALQWLPARGYYPLTTRYVAHRLAMTSALRAVTAVELYRIERGALPERLDDLGDISRFGDPMTGLLFQVRPQLDNARRRLSAGACRRRDHGAGRPVTGTT